MSAEDTSELPGGNAGFSEKDFYLDEFRGRTLAIALPQAKPDELGPLESVLAELAANRTRSLILSKDRASLARVTDACVDAAADASWAGRLWRELQRRSSVGVLVPAEEDLASACRRVVLRLRLAKLLWIDASGPLVDAAGDRISWLDVAAIDRLLEGPTTGAVTLPDERRRLLEEVRIMVRSGLPAVNLCGFDGVADDLFTFEGAGTFFARDRYLEVRRIALDEFDAANDLIGRGVAEGYLVERSQGQLDAVLSNAFGVFVEGRYLAGLGALLPASAVPGEGEPLAGEICSLYTLTRFLGEGIGGRLVSFALDYAAECGFTYVFACTTSERVQAFFRRHGFRSVGPEEIPAAKWQSYPRERQGRVLCVRRDLDPRRRADLA